MYKSNQVIDSSGSDDVYQIYRNHISTDEADTLYSFMNENSDWETKKIKMNGKELCEKRETITFALNDNTSFKYSGNSNKSKVMPIELVNILNKVNKEFNGELNLCLCNKYIPTSSIGEHSDNENELNEGNIISISLGQTRRFIVRPKKVKGETSVRKRDIIFLNHGDVLIMKEGMQQTHTHEVPAMLKSETISTQYEKRINLTFRKL
jgi:alkylated DNA repair dioxygenase AlkB